MSYLLIKMIDLPIYFKVILMQSHNGSGAN